MAVTTEPSDTTLSTAPVKVAIERHVRPGQDAAFRAWATRLTAAAHDAPGHEGSSVIGGSSGGAQVILLRFASEPSAQRWCASPVYRALLREADASSVPGEAPQVRSGLETWFTIPGAPPRPAPPRWKMALVTWLALLPQVVALAYLLAPLHLPFLVNAAVSTAIPVAMLAWVVMPRLTRQLEGWLHAR